MLSMKKGFAAAASLFAVLVLLATQTQSAEALPTKDEACGWIACKGGSRACADVTAEGNVGVLKVSVTYHCYEGTRREDEEGEDLFLL